MLFALINCVTLLIFVVRSTMMFGIDFDTNFEST